MTKLIPFENFIVYILLACVFYSCKKDKPSLPRPAEIGVTNITDTSCTISWSVVSNASVYKLTLATDSLFTTIVANFNDITGTSIDIDNLIPSTKYFIRVIAVNKDISSEPSTASFTTLDAERYVILGDEDNNNLYALDAKSGILKWTFKTGGKIYASPTIANNVAYIGSGDGRLYAINVADGSLKWKTGLTPTASAYDAAAIEDNGVIYIGDYGGRFYAFNAVSGALIWYYDVPSPYRNIGSSPVVENGSVYFASYDGKLYALDALSGSFKWVSNSTGNPVTSGISLQNNTLYVGGGPKVYAFDAATGATKWVSSVPQFTSFHSSPTVHDNTVFIGGEDGTFYAYDASNGSLKWEKYLSFGSIMSSPIYFNGVLYVGDGGGKLYALNAGSGDILWTNNDMGTKNIYSGPAMTTKTIYAGTLDGHVLAIDKQNGLTKWKTTIPGGRFQSSPCIVTYKGDVYHPGISGKIQ